MRRTLAVTFVVAISACGPATSAPPAPAPNASQECAFDIVQPDKSATAAAFRAWLKPRADELVDGGEIDEGDVYIADLDNSGDNEILFARAEGSGSYLASWVFRGSGNNWSLVPDVPFEDKLLGAHEYRGPMMNEPQLVSRLCGKTILSVYFDGEPNYYPVGMLWQGKAATTVCTGPWLARHHRAARDLVNSGMLDEARVLLDGVAHGCEKEAPTEWHAIQDELAAIAARTAGARADTYDFSWVKSEAKSHPDAQLVLDPRFSAMLVAIVPDGKLENMSWRGALKLSLWLPDDTHLIEDRYIVISGCEPHNCPNRGFVWIDTATKQAIAMTNGSLASRSTAADKIPGEFWAHTADVVGTWTGDETVDFIDRSGKTAKVRVP